MMDACLLLYCTVTVLYCYCTVLLLYCTALHCRPSRRLRASSFRVNEWPELIPGLLSNMGMTGTEGPAVNVREATLETLGFVCEEIAESHALAQEQVNR